MTDESLLDKVWVDLFPKNIKFVMAPVHDFPSLLFQDEKEINCAYFMGSAHITSHLRVWLKENIEDTVYILSKDHSCYYGLNFFFIDPKDATKFAIAFGDKIQKVE